MIPGTKSSLYVEEIFEFSDILYGTCNDTIIIILYLNHSPSSQSLETR